MNTACIFQSLGSQRTARIGFDTKAACYVVHVYEGGVCKRRIPCHDHRHAWTVRASFVGGES